LKTNYPLFEINGIYKKADWQDLLFIFKDLYNPLNLRTFKGSSDDPSTDEYTLSHWLGDNDKMGFGQSIILNADNNWGSFKFSFYDISDEDRYIKVNISSRKNELILIGSLDNEQKLRDAILKIKSAFIFRGNSLKETSFNSSSFFFGGELEQKFKILFSQPQEIKDFNSLYKNFDDFTLKIGVLFLDIDRFKDLNIKFTETKIDVTILPEFQELIKKLIIYRGKAYRHGGEEFVIVLPNHHREETNNFAERLRKTIENYNFKVNDEKVNVTVSIGLAIYPDHGRSFDEVLNAANNAEHQAKQEGRNKVKISS